MWLSQRLYDRENKKNSKGVFAYFDCIFDCISHELLLPKLQACGFEKISLILYMLT